MAAVTEEATAGERASSGLSKLIWTPPWLKWNPDKNYEMSWAMACFFGFVRLPIVEFMNDDAD